MLDKRCPFCMSMPVSYNIDGKFIIECPKCKEKNITVRVESDTWENACDCWNIREYDNYLFKNSDKIKDIIKNQNIFNIKDEESEKIFDTIRFENINEGCFIVQNGDVIECKHDHIQKLYDYIGIDTDNKSLTDPTICLKFNMVRISIFTNIIAISLPEKVNKKQIDIAIQLLCKEKYKNINKFYYHKKELNNDILKEFNNINDLVLELDKIKSM